MAEPRSETSEYTQHWVLQDEEAFHSTWDILVAQNEVLAGGGVAQDHNPRSPGGEAVELQELMIA